MREVDCSYRTEEVESKMGTFCPLNHKDRRATRSVDAMMMSRRRRMMSQ